MKESDIKIIVKEDSITFKGKETLEYLHSMYDCACGEQAYETKELERFFHGKESVRYHWPEDFEREATS